MKRLVLLRHAKSEWAGSARSGTFLNDMERPLSERGRGACKKMSEFFIRTKLTVDLVEFSPAKRAVDTFNLVRGSLSFSSCKPNSDLYTFSSECLRNVVAAKSNEVNSFLLIGHNPAIEELVKALVPEKYKSKDFKSLIDKYPTGAIVFLDLNISNWSEIKNNCGNLISFVRPKDMLCKKKLNS